MSYKRIIAITLIISSHASAAEWEYLVYNEGENLSMISTRLYGTQKYTQDLARWNNIQNPDYVWLGTRLKLQKSPTLSPEEGDLLVRKMKARLTGKSLSHFKPRIVPEKLRRPYHPRPTPYAERRNSKLPKPQMEKQPTEELSTALVPTDAEIEKFINEEFKPGEVPKRDLASTSADDKMLEQLIRKTPIKSTNTGPMEMGDLVETDSHLLAQFTYQELYDRAIKYHNQNKFEISAKYFRICREAMPQFIPCWIYELSSLKQLKDRPTHEQVKELLLKKHPHLASIKKQISY